MLGVTILKRNDKSYVILRQRNEPFIIPNVPCCTEPKKNVCICSLRYQKKYQALSCSCGLSMLNTALVFISCKPFIDYVLIYTYNEV